MMRKNLIVTLTTTLLLFACKKETHQFFPPPAAESASVLEYAPLTVGNYWVYAIVYYDSAGTEIPTAYTDSVTVIGDSVVNGHTFSVFQGTRPLHNPGNPQSYRYLLRDSADCIIGLGGGIVFSLSDLGSVFAQAVIPPNGTMTWSTDPDQVQHTVPAGTFTCYDTHKEASLPGYLPRTMHHLRGQGVGIVQDEMVYLDSPGSGFRRKLVSYYVQ
ncbi:MAG: hypothetical protein IPG69_09845 [Flavobacteriales bacterium]|nr:hypothetical protein [Flavobacteriales bacterium]